MRRLVTLLVLLACSSPVARAAAETARGEDEFLQSIGVCTHFSYPDTPYGAAYEKVKQRLIEAGIHHVRDGKNDRIADLASAAVRTTLVAEPELGSPEQIKDLVKSLNTPTTSVEAVEGPNEADLFWKQFKKSYHGEGFPKGVIAFQKDLYHAIKSDPATRDLIVVGPSLGVTYGYDVKSPFGTGTLRDAVDRGCFHPYPGGNPFSLYDDYDTINWYYANGNFPACNIDEFPYAFDVYAPPFAPKPMCATETGYSTFSRGTSEAAQGKYVPRIYCEYFRKGVARTFIYEFVDEFDRRDDEQANYGLLHHDLSPKPAYTAMSNLIRLLQGATPPAGKLPADKPTLDFDCRVTPVGAYTRTQYVHHLLLSRGPGKFDLLIWHEVSAEDRSVSPHRQITVPPLPATFTFAKPFTRATIYKPSASLDPVRTLEHAGEIKLELSDDVMLVRLEL